MKVIRISCLSIWPKESEESCEKKAQDQKEIGLGHCDIRNGPEGWYNGIELQRCDRALNG